MKGPLVSVIMPVYNAGWFVMDAAHSILEQTHENLELIIVDDGSTDGAADRLLRLEDPRVKISSLPQNSGAATARNFGMDQAHGAYIAFLDADDMAVRSRLATQLDFLADHPGIDVVSGGARYIDETDEQKDLMTGLNVAGPEIPSTLLFGNCIAQSSVMVRAERMIGQRFRAGTEPAEDYDLWSRLSVDTNFHALEEPLIYYRKHASGVSAREPRKMIKSVQTIQAEALGRLGITDVPPFHSRLMVWGTTATRAELLEAGAWLQHLRMANRTHRIYDEKAFDAVIARFWFTICCDSWDLGWTAWRTFHAFPFGGMSMRERALFLRRIAPRTFRRKR